MDTAKTKDNDGVYEPSGHLRFAIIEASSACWHTLVGIIGAAQRGWLRWQSAVAALYFQRVTLPLQFWHALGCPPEFTPQLPWWQSVLWRYLVITGMRRSRVARPPVEQRGPEHYPVRFMQ